MKALKPFIDCNQKTIKRNQVIKESDYRKDVWNKYIKASLVGPSENKKAEATQKPKSEPSENKKAEATQKPKSEPSENKKAEVPKSKGKK